MLRDRTAHPSSSARNADAGFLASGVSMLAVAMGIGRFAYTPLLPAMERDAGLTVSAAGGLAFFNLLGYFVGALLAMHPLTHRNRLPIVRWSLGCLILTLGLMAGPSLFWIPLRFLAGIASGFVLIFSSSIVLERAARVGRPWWPPVFFSGVGVGIACSGVAVPLLVAHTGSRGAWVGIAVFSTLVLAPTARWFFDDAPPTVLAPTPKDAGRAKVTASYIWLLVVYTAAAFAYVIPATFLVAIVTAVPSVAAYASLSWVVVGIAGALATFAWIGIGARLGKAAALATALGIEGLGTAAPVLSKTPFAVIFAAIALGGTFMAITLFASGLARDLYPHRTSGAVSRLTMLFSIGQMIGPVVATQLALRSGSYHSALLAAAGSAGLAAIATLVNVHDP